MLETKKVSFQPTKQFFIDTLTRDLDLDVAILDLIDNSIDSYIINEVKSRKYINIAFNKNSFCIEDNCGGIPLDKIYNDVFRIGLLKQDRKNTIGVWGIGLKRAIFKLGRNIKLESDDGKNFFSIEIDKAWFNDNDNWYTKIAQQSSTKGKPMFRLTVGDLRPEIAEDFASTPFKERLIEKIQQFHSIYIQECVDICINNIKIIPFQFKLLDDGKTFAALREKNLVNNVEVEIVAGFTKEEKLHGWCIFCNDRMVLMNDVSNRTGFEPGVISYHPFQDAEFLGLVFFRSKDPSELPWRSGKDNISTESNIYRCIRAKMVEITRELLTKFTRLLYSTKDSAGESIGKSIFVGVKDKPWYTIKLPQKIKYPNLRMTPHQKEPTKYTTVQYQIEKKLISSVKKHMASPTLANYKVGIKTFMYYVKMEEIEQ